MHVRSDTRAHLERDNSAIEVERSTFAVDGEPRIAKVKVLLIVVTGNVRWTLNSSSPPRHVHASTAVYHISIKDTIRT